MDSFQNYLKKQLLTYVQAERKKGIPLEQIESVLLDAGHEKNLIDEVFLDLEKEMAGKKTTIKNPVEKDMVRMMKSAFSQFMAQGNKKEIDLARKDMSKEKTEEVVEEVIKEERIIEEKNTFESIAFFLYLVALGIIIFMSAGMTDSEIVSVALGFLPAILSIFVSFFMISIADNVPLYVFIPLVICSIFYTIGRFAGIGLFQGLEMEALSVVNFVLAFIFNITVVYIRFIKPESMKKRFAKTKNMPAFVENKNNVPSEKRFSSKEIQDLKKEFNIK